MRDLPAPVYVSSVRAQGLRPRRGGTTLAMTTCSVLPSVPYDAVGPPNSIFLSRLNTQPTRCPVNASPLPSRTATHDSGPTWFATPWLGGTCTRETYRFVPAHRLVKILEHPAGQKFTRFQDRRRHRRSGSRMSILTSRRRGGRICPIPRTGWRKLYPSAFNSPLLSWRPLLTNSTLFPTSLAR